MSLADRPDCTVRLDLCDPTDYLVDDHFKAVQQLDEQNEALEQLLFEDGRDEVRTVQRRPYALRKDLVLLRTSSGATGSERCAMITG